MYNLESLVRSFVVSSLNSSRGKGRCETISAHHSSNKGSPSGSALVEIDVQDPLPSDGHEVIIAEVVSTIRLDANGAGGMNHYLLRAAFSDKGSVKEQRVRCRADDEENEIVEGEDRRETDTETVNVQIVKALQTANLHAEQMTRISAGIMQTVVGGLSNTIATLTQQNEKLQAKHLETVQLAEEMMSQKHTRELESRKAEQSIALKAKLAETVVKEVGGVLPVAVRHLLKMKPQLPAGEVATPAGGAEEKPSRMLPFLKMLSRETLTALFNLLTPAQRNDALSVMAGIEGIEIEERFLSSLDETQTERLWGLLTEEQREALLSLAKPALTQTA